GPMGWRYFGRVHPPKSEEELFTVDYVVDAEWGLLRYRLMDQSGTRIVATPATAGIDVVTGRPGDERIETVAGASAVWSSSPCSLLVLDRPSVRRAGATWPPYGSGPHSSPR